MTVILFILVLVVLIVVHEFGHFIVAKWSKMRVDEFGLGYPPRALTIAKRGETEYTLNWIPFGGFVRIYGEDEADAIEGASDVSRSFAARPRILQAVVLLAGIAMNLLLAYVLITMTLIIGTPQALTDEQAATAPDASLIIANVLPGSPAETAGLKEGDFIRVVTGPAGTFKSYNGKEFTDYVSKDTDAAPLHINVLRDNVPVTLVAVPKVGSIAADPTRPALGVAVATVGTLPVSWWQAPIQGAVLTWEVTKQTALGLAQFFGGILTLHADLSQVSGPVGIAGAVGNAYSQGIAALLTITALISINLALINLIPVPALDGGRLLFVIIEAIIRRPIKPSIARAFNTVSFGLLLLLMLAVTGHDLFKLIPHAGTKAAVQPVAVLNTDLLPLYPDASWQAPIASNTYIGTTSTDGAQATTTAKENITDIAAITMPFEAYYRKLLTDRGWKENKYLDADSGGGGERVYQKDGQSIELGWHSTFANAAKMEPAECPCSTTLSVYSTPGK